MTYEEHLVWCKQRAMAYLDDGDLANAVASMGNDIPKHPEGMTHGSSVLAGLMLVALFDVAAGNSEAIKRWINGFR